MAKLAESQDGLCAWCLRPLDAVGKLQLDHLIPVTRGGPEDWWNRQVLHASCNSEKAAQITPEARQLAVRHDIELAGDDGSEPKGVAYRMGVMTAEEIIARAFAA